MNIELKIFIEEVKDLFKTNKNEIVGFFNDDGVLGCVEICSECFKQKVRLTNMTIPRQNTWKEVSKLIEKELDVDVMEENYEELRERGGLCDCDGEGFDEFKKAKSY